MTATPVSPEQQPEQTLLEVLTFLIADIRGYTRFTQEQGDRAAARLAMKFATLVHETVEALDGDVIELRGDEALAVFRSSPQAVRAAVALQARCARETEADPSLPLRVGAGIDVGEAVAVEGGYRGLVLNMAARLCSLAGAGEVYATQGVALSAQRIVGLAYVERGRVQLKGIAEPVRIIQVLPEADLPANFPPLVSLVARPSNLPVQATPFVGRARELQDVTDLLRRDTVRLLTLLGPGGAGKTRLAIGAGSVLLDDFERGVFLVPLAPLIDPALVISTIASTFKLKDVVGKDLLQTVKDYLVVKNLLLILDNFEHLLEAAPIVADLLVSCKDLKILVTSQAVLRLSAEFEYAVPPLSVPDPRHLSRLDKVAACDAVALFVQRAQAVKPNFELTEDNTQAVVEICRSLDGLPLALELAAARVRMFEPAALLSRLSNRLQLLASGARDLPARQQTMRGALDWSFSLLNEPEMVLLARLAVFRGGTTLEAAELVCTADGELATDVFDGMTSLVEKSLLNQEGDVRGNARFSMLYSIREYALEKLRQRGEDTTMRLRHAAYYRSLAEEGKSRLRGPDQTAWLELLEVEHDNVRAALDTAIEIDAPEIGLATASALERFWSSGYAVEGHVWLDKLLCMGGTVNPVILARALECAAIMTQLCRLGDTLKADAQLEESLSLYQQVGDRAGTASVLCALGAAVTAHGDHERALDLFSESLHLFSELGDKWGTGAVLFEMGTAAYARGNLEEAIQYFEQVLTLSHELGDHRRVAGMLNNLAWLALCRNDYDQAVMRGEEAVSRLRKLGTRFALAVALNTLGYALLATGDHNRAMHLHREELMLRQEMQDVAAAVGCLQALGCGLAGTRQPVGAARLWGAAEAARRSQGSALSDLEARISDSYRAMAQAAVDDETFQAARQEGEAKPLETAISDALAPTLPQRRH